MSKPTQTNNTDNIKHPTSTDIKPPAPATKGTIQGGRTGTGRITPRGK